MTSYNYSRQSGETNYWVIDLLLTHVID